MVKTQAWHKLEETLAGYATRLELYNSQTSRLHWIISLSGLGGAIIMLMGAFLGRRSTAVSEDRHASKKFNGTNEQ